MEQSLALKELMLSVKEIDEIMNEDFQTKGFRRGLVQRKFAKISMLIDELALEVLANYVLVRAEDFYVGIEGKKQMFRAKFQTLRNLYGVHNPGMNAKILRAVEIAMSAAA